MNKYLILRKIVMVVLVALMLTSNYVLDTKAVLIDPTRKASLTITKYEHANGNLENKGLEEVEFTIYLIQDTINSVEEAEQYISDNQAVSYKGITPKSGTITFSNLELGRYLVVETKAPKNVVTKVQSFLIDLPRSNNNGNGWDYDVTVYPKNITIYGSVILNQLSKDNRPLPGVTWVLEKQINQQWEKYDYEGTLVTDTKGKIIIENLEVGEYRLLPEKAPDGYIVDASDNIEFSITTKKNDYEFTVKSEKLKLDNYILLDDGTYGKSKSVFKKDVNSWKIVSEVADIISKMDEYKITNKLSDGLIYVDNSIRVYGINENGEEIEVPEEYYKKNVSSNELGLDFNTRKIDRYKNIIVKYDTNFEDKVSYGNFENTSYLVYTNYVSEKGISKGTYKISSKASTYTGAVLIKKIDQNGKALSGAVFKIANSKEDAKEKKFITNKDGEDITATSDENGYVFFNGLKYNDSTEYYIVEVQAPSYEEEGETKYYNLLESPIKVIVNSNSHNYLEGVTTMVVNKKGFVLPMTGGTLSIVSYILGALIILVVLCSKKRSMN
ncbi:MAG: hypothetical protein HFJ17_03700 [Clostridia bacterium]|nr:hypothetical protein [Clostridia bacterium]